MSTREGWIGRPFLSRDGKIKGKVQSCSSRYCCVAGVKIVGDEPIQII